MKANTFIKPSKIHGLGLFADKEITKGEEIVQPLKPNLSRNIDEWILYVKTHKLPSFALNCGYCMINHSENPNTKRYKEDAIRATRKINEGEEITENYYFLPDNENPFYNTLEKIIYHAKQLTP